MKKVFENKKFELYVDEKIEMLDEPIINNTLKKLDLFRKIFYEDQLEKTKVIVFSDQENFRIEACKRRTIKNYK